MIDIDLNDIAATAGKKIAQQQDEAVRKMLKRNGIKWSNNIETLRENLRSFGYELISERSQTPMSILKGEAKTVTTFKLVKIVDSIDFVVNYKVDFGE